MEILDHQRTYWKNKAEESQVDLEIKKQTLIKKKKDIELQDRAIRHLALKDKVLQNRLPQEDQPDSLTLRPDELAE